MTQRQRSRGCVSRDHAAPALTQVVSRCKTVFSYFDEVRCNSSPFHLFITRRPASADRTARRQFQATGQPVSRTQASDTMTSRQPRYEAKCVQRRCFQLRSARLRSDIKGTELPHANILIPVKRQYIVCATTLPLTVYI